MSIHPARLLASLLLLAGGFVVGVSVLAIAMARLLVNAGMTVRPADAALLGDLVPVLPLIAGFAAINLVAAVGILLGKGWGDVTAFGAAVVAVVIGTVGLVLIVVGRDPLASTSTSHATADGIGIVGAFTVAYLVVIAALVVARRPRRVATGFAA